MLPTQQAAAPTVACSAFPPLHHAADAPPDRCLAADAALSCDFAELPLPIVMHIFEALPADARALCGCVCRAWREHLLAGPDAARLWWTHLDLSLTSGMTCTRGDAALAGATALARGGLEVRALPKWGARRFGSPRRRARWKGRRRHAAPPCAALGRA